MNKSEPAGGGEGFVPEHLVRLRENIKVARIFAVVALIPMAHISFWGFEGSGRLGRLYPLLPGFAIVVSGLAIYGPLIHGSKFVELRMRVRTTVLLLIAVAGLTVFFYSNLEFSSR